MTTTSRAVHLDTAPSGRFPALRQASLMLAIGATLLSPTMGRARSDDCPLVSDAGGSQVLLTMTEWVMHGSCDRCSQADYTASVGLTLGRAFALTGKKPGDPQARACLRVIEEIVLNAWRPHAEWPNLEPSYQNAFQVGINGWTNVLEIPEGDIDAGDLVKRLADAIREVDLDADTATDTTGSAGSGGDHQPIALERHLVGRWQLIEETGPGRESGSPRVETWLTFGVDRSLRLDYRDAQSGVIKEGGRFQWSVPAGTSDIVISWDGRIETLYTVHALDETGDSLVFRQPSQEEPQTLRLIRVPD